MGNINLITITIISLSIPTSGICSINIVHIALFQIFAAGAGAVLAQSMAMLPAHVGKADQSKDHRNCGKAQEDIEIIRFST